MGGTDVKIAILTENTVNARGLLAEHGLSVLVEAKGRRLLFDAGQSGVYRHNAGRMGISLEELDGIVLSHGHYDHTGGLEEYAGEKPPVVYMRRTALEKKLCTGRDKTAFREIGIPWRERKMPFAFHFTKEKEEIFPDIYVLGEIPAVVPQEKQPGLFYVQRGERILPDPMADEQLLVIRTDEGLAVFAGCAHVGILNCLERVKGAFPGERFRFLLAGMHLRGCGNRRIEDTVQGLRGYGFAHIIPLHCTGTEAIARMREAFGKTCLAGDAGRSYDFGQD